jgi:hypothetical protein
MQADYPERYRAFARWFSIAFAANRVATSVSCASSPVGACGCK